MKIHGLDWMDWLHKTGRESERKRKQLGLSRVEWRRRIEQEADQIRPGLAAKTQPIARDKPQSDKEVIRSALTDHEFSKMSPKSPGRGRKGI
jgi:hypothetical protein